MEQRSFALSTVWGSTMKAVSDSWTGLPSSSSYRSTACTLNLRRHGWWHSPRHALFPNASWLMRQRPDSATHCAPWTKHSISTPVFRTISATSASVHSRARTTLSTPCEARNDTAREFEVDIWVETCTAAPCFLHRAITPQSETMKASTHGFAATIVRSTSSTSPSNMMAFSVR